MKNNLHAWLYHARNNAICKRETNKPNTEMYFWMCSRSQKLSAGERRSRKAAVIWLHKTKLHTWKKTRGYSGLWFDSRKITPHDSQRNCSVSWHTHWGKVGDMNTIHVTHTPLTDMHIYKSSPPRIHSTCTDITALAGWSQLKIAPSMALVVAHTIIDSEINKSYAAFPQRHLP